MVVFATLKLRHKLRSGSHVWYYCVLEATNARFKLIASIKEHNIVATLRDKFIDLDRGEMLTSTNDTIFVDLNFVGYAESNNFVSYSDL